MKKIVLTFILLIAPYIVSAQIQIPEDNNGMEKLCNLLQGNFSSEEQSKQDTNYFHIVLHIKPMWQIRSDGIWFYVEQAAAWKQEKPYRQRVYKLTKIGDNDYTSDVFTFENPLNYAGDWKKENPLADLSPDKLNKRDGCTVYLIRDSEDSFSGSTRGTGCAGDSREAKYVTSEVTVNSEGFFSWDRGFDEKGSQVWGAVNGPYIFKRQK